VDGVEAAPQRRENVELSDHQSWGLKWGLNDPQIISDSLGWEMIHEIASGNLLHSY